MRIYIWFSNGFLITKIGFTASGVPDTRIEMLQAAIRVGARMGTRRSAPGAMARTTRDRLMFRSFASYPDHTEVTMPALSPVRL